jgi:Holliday junction resolvase-like predicted endonuclease
VACDERGTVLFVEVKTRVVSDGARVAGQAERAVNASKQARYRRMACHYQQRTGCRDIRFDVAAIDVVPGQAVRLRYIRGAFGCDD